MRYTPEHGWPLLLGRFTAVVAAAAFLTVSLQHAPHPIRAQEPPAIADAAPQPSPPSASPTHKHGPTHIPKPSHTPTAPAATPAPTPSVRQPPSQEPGQDAPAIETQEEDDAETVQGQAPADPGSG
ncbi:hypothetical protein ACFVXG_15230 [Kitasatospora sp. NPDC058162]|uniref:hypothetical protein n=1 Tax=Kitasatospora sp. NPDC058162 TaxID=3346362 RepID=UPI0036DD3217